MNIYWIELNCVKLYSLKIENEIILKLEEPQTSLGWSNFILIFKKGEKETEKLSDLRLVTTKAKIKSFNLNIPKVKPDTKYEHLKCISNILCPCWLRFAKLESFRIWTL